MVNLKKNKKDHYAPKRWTLGKVSGKLKGLLHKIWGEKKGSKEWYLFQFKRELEQMKKHIIFLEQVIEFYEQADDSK